MSNTSTISSSLPPSLPPSFSLTLPRSRFLFLRFSLCRCRAESNSNRCPRGHSQKLRGMREGGNVEGNRALRESKGEFLLFIYELFIRLVELSLLPFSLTFSLSVPSTSYLVLSTNASTNPERKKDGENGKKGGKYAALLRPRGCRKSLVCQGRKKMRHFSA